MCPIRTSFLACFPWRCYLWFWKEQYSFKSINCRATRNEYSFNILVKSSNLAGNSSFSVGRTLHHFFSFLFCCISFSIPLARKKKNLRAFKTLNCFKTQMFKVFFFNYFALNVVKFLLLFRPKLSPFRISPPKEELF